MLRVVIALESAFATQLYVRFATLSQSACCAPPLGFPPLGERPSRDVLSLTRSAIL
jgi:hypothetical protein